ncbi:MAG TPA: hypothetical protein VFB58_18515 [Chloroflexota bacterium]|nr:hypothetical protein [Chloroflexota bacterium]
MDDELVLLTSYFNLVDGRRQDNADTFRVDTDLPSESSPDGTEALYIVTEASVAGPSGQRARKLATDTIAFAFRMSSEGTVVARIKAALQAAHDEVRREFDEHVVVGATVMAVEHDSVYLAQVPPSQVYVLHEGGLHSLGTGTPTFGRALGGSGPPKISVYRDEIAQGDVLALCSTWFDQIDHEDLRATFSRGTADDIAEALLVLAQDHDARAATAIVIEAAAAHELEVIPGEQSPGLMEQVDIAVQALADVGRMLIEELRPVPLEAGEDGNGQPVPEPALAGITTESPLVEPRSAATATVDQRQEQHTQEYAIVDAEVAPGVETVRERRAPRGRRPRLNWRMPSFRPGTTPPEVTPNGDEADRPSDEHGWRYVPREEAPIERERDEPTVDLEPTFTPRWEPTLEQESVARPSHNPREDVTEELPAIQVSEAVPDPVSDLQKLNSRLQATNDASEMDRVIPPIQAFEDTSIEPARIYATNKDIDAVNRRPRRYGGLSAPVIRPGLGDIDLRQRVSRPTPSWMVWAGAAVMFALIVGAVGLYLRHRLHAATPPYISYVRLDLAQATASHRPATQAYYLTRARHFLTLARQSGTAPTVIAKWSHQITATSDAIYHITDEANATLLTDFTRFPGAHPTAIATSPGEVYVVDTGRKSIFSIAPTARTAPVEILLSGDTIGGFTVAVPQFVATDGNTVVVLDNKGVLYRDTAGTKTATALTSQTPKPGNYVAMAVSDPDVYLLDTANNQVWRYPYAVSGYNPTQAAYWDSNPPRLTDANSLTFNRNSLYILRRSGTVLRYNFQANPQPFTLNLKTPLANPTEVYTDPNQKFVWIADPANGRILQVGQDGTYDRTYVSSGSMNLHQMQSMSVGPAGNTIYVLAGSRLYAFPVKP